MSLTAVVPLLEGSVIGPRNLIDLVACPPCCAQPCNTATAAATAKSTNANNNSFIKYQLQSSLLTTTLNDTVVAATTASRNHHRVAESSSPIYYRKAGSLLSDSDNDDNAADGWYDDDDDDESDEEDDDDDDVLLPGVLAAGVEYRIKRILVEGWLHKKGTGRDWLGCQGWKARWARLCLATRVDNNEHGNNRCENYKKNAAAATQIDVPLLLVSWYPTGFISGGGSGGTRSMNLLGSSTPSTVILLDSTVVMAVDIPENNDNNNNNGNTDGSTNNSNNDRWNAHRFEIRHASTRENATLPTNSRTFCAPRKARDAWLYAISQALLLHAKQKDRLRKLRLQQESSQQTTMEKKALQAIPTNNNQHTRRNLNDQPQSADDHHRRPTSPTFGEVWTGDRFVTAGTRESVSNSPVLHEQSSPSSTASCSNSPTHSSRHWTTRGRGGGALSSSSPPTSPKLPRPYSAAGSFNSTTRGSRSKSNSNRRHSFQNTAPFSNSSD
jgi:hypothetical protein